MELYLLWIIVGIAIVTAEMLTGTFYLLVISAGAFVAALVAWLGLNVVFQTIIGGIVALGGTLWQDLATQHPGGRVHRDWEVYDRHAHDVSVEPGSRLACSHAGPLSSPGRRGPIRQETAAPRGAAPPRCGRRSSRRRAQSRRC